MGQNSWRPWAGAFSHRAVSYQQVVENGGSPAITGYVRTASRIET
jgi:hypothetical protein